jgi:VanZ like family/Concanavalin A-like lectin/glucanases superfamily
LKWPLVTLSTLVLGATLTAGLWPFSFQAENSVAWSPEQGGLRFAGTGLVASKGEFEASDSDAADGCSMELWIEPGLSWGSSALLTFYRPGRTATIQIRQSGDDLVFAVYGAPAPRARRQVFVDHVFRAGQRVLVTLVSAGGGLEIYVDGSLRTSATQLSMRRSDFTGNLILGNAHNGNMSWAGTFRGMALYERALNAAEIRENVRLWQQDRQQIARRSSPALALYLFDEGQGAVVHNTGRTGPDLGIPEKYSVAEPVLLVPLWTEFRASREYVKDLAVNVFGLLPLGFCSAALWTRLKGPRRCLLYATAFGFSVSLTIELLQAYMPTRSSGSTDLITNTLGAALGAWLYLTIERQNWFKCGK